MYVEEHDVLYLPAFVRNIRSLSMCNIQRINFFIPTYVFFKLEFLLILSLLLLRRCCSVVVVIVVFLFDAKCRVRETESIIEMMIEDMLPICIRSNRRNVCFGSYCCVGRCLYFYRHMTKKPTRVRNF